MSSNLQNRMAEINPPKTACGCPYGGILKKNCHIRNLLTLWNAFVNVHNFHIYRMTPKENVSTTMGNCTTKSLIRSFYFGLISEALPQLCHQGTRACRKALGFQTEPAADNQLHQYHPARRLWEDHPGRLYKKNEEKTSIAVVITVVRMI